MTDLPFMLYLALLALMVALALTADFRRRASRACQRRESDLRVAIGKSLIR